MALRSVTDEEDARIDRIFDHLQMFVEDVLEDPSILERIPDQATLEFTPIEEKDPYGSYVTETRRLAVSMKKEPAPAERTGSS